MLMLCPMRPTLTGSLFLCLIATATAAQADLFKYKDGRIVYGKVVGTPSKETVDNIQTDVWNVEVDEGVLVRIRATELITGGHEALSDQRNEFLKHAQATALDFDSQSKLIQFCNSHGLSDLTHAIRMFCVDLDPDHHSNRVAAGFDTDSEGRYRKLDDMMIMDRGMVKLGARKFRYPEEIALLKSREADNDTIAAVTKDIYRAHRTVGIARPGTRQYQDAILRLQQINDPLATGVVAKFLEEDDLPDPLKLLYVQTLIRFQNPAAAVALARAAMLDANAQIRNACLSGLTQYGGDIAIGVFASYLTSSSNVLVNRAADGLAQLNARGTVLQLIPALVTEHEVMPGSNGMNASPTSGAFSAGEKKAVKAPIRNPSVRGALTQFTGQSLGYDANAWMAWYASVYGPPVSDLRRDP